MKSLTFAITSSQSIYIYCCIIKSRNSSFPRQIMSVQYIKFLYNKKYSLKPIQAIKVHACIQMYKHKGFDKVQTRALGMCARTAREFYRNMRHVYTQLGHYMQ